LTVVKAQDPDSITWLTKPWPKWDKTVYDPTKMTPAAFYAALFPNGDGDQLVGLREVVYQYKPFADDRNPTKVEVDEWHRIAINHLRSLLGYASANLQVANSTATNVAGFTTISGGCYPDLATRNLNNKIDTCNNWTADLHDQVDTLGMAFNAKGLMAGKLQVNGDISLTRAVTNADFTGGNYASIATCSRRIGPMRAYRLAA
jgi:hypothetical protein